MTDETQEADTKPVSRRGRKPKSDGVRTERRNRGASMGQLRSKLDLPDHLRGDVLHVYRWFSDKGSRINDQIQYNEWDLVASNGEGEASDRSGAYSITVGKLDDGSPHVQYLMRKPKHFSDEDRQVQQDAIDRKMTDLRSGKVSSSDLRDNGYVPKEGIRLR